MPRMAGGRHVLGNRTLGMQHTPRHHSHADLVAQTRIYPGFGIAHRVHACMRAHAAKAGRRVRGSPHGQRGCGHGHE